MQLDIEWGGVYSSRLDAIEEAELNVLNIYLLERDSV